MIFHAFICRDDFIFLDFTFTGAQVLESKAFLWEIKHRKISFCQITN